MSAEDRDVLDRLGRLLVVVALVFVVMFSLGVALATLGLGLRPLYALLLSATIVYVILYIYYGRHLHRVI